MSPAEAPPSEGLAPEASALTAAAPLFAALGDAQRLALLVRLSAGPTSLTRLSEGTGISRQAISRHLQVLADVGLAEHRREGRETRWQAGPESVARARASLDQLSRLWDQRLARLKRFVESD